MEAIESLCPSVETPKNSSPLTCIYTPFKLYLVSSVDIEKLVYSIIFASSEEGILRLTLESISSIAGKATAGSVNSSKRQLAPVISILLESDTCLILILASGIFLTISESICVETVVSPMQRTSAPISWFKYKSMSVAPISSIPDFATSFMLLSSCKTFLFSTIEFAKFKACTRSFV